jgi:hypothetical protein
MHIPLKTWLRIRQLQQEAIGAADALTGGLLAEADARRVAGDDEGRKLLMRLALRAEEASRDAARFDVTPQGEWMGGPTEGPGSEKTRTKLREPNAAPLPHRHFTQAELDEAVAASLLPADHGYSGDAPPAPRATS